ncbi:MAG: four helix bundle protein [Candidatus Sulfotelmatobacter sp.]
MSSQPEQLRDRTKAFALRVIRLYRSLPYKTDTQVLGKQLLRCSTSVAANYRAVCRARSKAEFITKMGVVVEEVDEAILWLELMTESGIVSAAKTEALLTEANELTAIFAASQRTARNAA